MATRATLTKRLKQYRAARRWTQQQLADAVGFSRAYIARLEIGRHDPTLSTLVKVARALRVKVTRLLE